MLDQEEVLNSRFFTVDDGELVILHNSGFFSNATIGLHGITEFYKAFQGLPLRVNFSKTFRDFTNYNGDDSYPLFFEFNAELDIPFVAEIGMSAYSLFSYRDESFNELAPFVEKYFSPTAEVDSIATYLAQKYEIDFLNTLAIVYRGTDKYRDTGLGSFSEYVDRAKVFLEIDPNLRVLVQTDQKQFLEYCKREIPNVFYFAELPMTTTDTVMHHVVPIDSKIDWAKRFLAVTTLLSKCRYVVTHSGNVGRWICLYRKNANGVVQYLRPKDQPQSAGGNFWIE